VFEHRIQNQDSWESIITEAKEYLNTYITPNEFAGLVFFEEEHPLMERESATGTRNISIYHTAGTNPVPIREQTSDLTSDIYFFKTITK
jgi:hypothetical protein